MAIRSSSLRWFRSLAAAFKKRHPAGSPNRRVHLEQLESRFALSAVPVAVNDPVGVDPISMEINAQSVQLPVALNDEDDLPNTSLTVLEATPPSHGTLIPDPNHCYAFLYTPIAGYTGADSFTYRVRDIDNQTSANTATVSLFVHPRAFAGLNYSIGEGGTLSLSSGANSEFNIPGSIGHGQLTYTWAIDPNIGNAFPTSLPPNIFDDFPVIHTANPTLTWDDLADWGIVNGNVANGIVALQVEDENHVFDTDFARLTVGNVNPELTDFTITSLGCGTDVTLNATILEANPNDQLAVFIDWDFLNFTDTEENLGAPVLVSQGPSGSAYSITVPLHHYAAPGFVLPVLRVVADGGGDGNFPETFDANNLGLVTNGVEDPDLIPDFPYFINVSGATGGVTSPAITGAPATSSEGTAITLGSSFTGGCGTPAFAWSVTKNGAATPYATGNSASFDLTPDDNGIYVVSLIVGGVSAPDKTITVNNVAPSVSVTATPLVSGSPDVSLSGTISDPGTADTFTVHVVWESGVTDDLSLPAGSTSFAINHHIYTSTGAKPISVTVSDDENDSDNDATSVTVQAALSGDGSSLSVLGSSSGDQISLTPGSVIVNINGVEVGHFNVNAGGSVTVSAGNGNDTISVQAGITVPVTVVGGAGSDTIVVVGTANSDTIVQTSSGFTANGTVINVGAGVEGATIDGGAGADQFVASGTPPVPVQVQAVNDMVIKGTAGNDQITFTPGGSAGQIVGKLNGVVVSQFAPTGKLIAEGFGGNDDLQVSGSINLAAWLYGGNGDDRLKGGAGNDVMLGEVGDDLLIGGSGRDLVIGGKGEDRIIGDPDDDILIAGFTDFDNNPSALSEIMGVWTSTANLLVRICQLSPVLENNGPSPTVHDDGNKDMLTGSEGYDWFFANLILDCGDDANTKDKITDLNVIESLFAEDIDFIHS